jgi:mRNA interferase MazF
VGRSWLTQRGDIVVVALQGDSGKPRPAVVIQADWFDALSTVVVLPLTSTLQDAAITRIDVTPDERNGLHLASQIAVDRPQTIRRTRIGQTIGNLDSSTMLRVERALAVFLGLA